MLENEMITRSMSHMETEVQTNPLEPIEDFLQEQDWPYHRAGANDLIAEVEGRWGSYRLQFVWQEEDFVLHTICYLDLKIDPKTMKELYELLSLLNERMVLGHFDIVPQEMAIGYRYSHYLRLSKDLNLEGFEEIIDWTLDEVERFYPAFQFVISGEKKAIEAASVALLDTVGEA